MADKIDYDLIYQKLEKAGFDCTGIKEIYCSDVANAGINNHVCLCYKKGCGIVMSTNRANALEKAYYNKTIQGKLKAILE
jgi:hypothetical protein